MLRPDVSQPIGRLLAEHHKEPVVVTIGGPTAAGKSTLADQVRYHFEDSALIKTDDYYFDDENMPPEVFVDDEIDYDHPHAVQLGRLAYDLSSLVSGLPILKPTYSMTKGHSGRLEAVRPRPLIVVEGLVANHPTIRALSDFAITVTAPRDVRLVRRIYRDFGLYRRRADSTTRIFQEYAEPAYRAYHAANDVTADLIIESPE